MTYTINWEDGVTTRTNSTLKELMDSIEITERVTDGKMVCVLDESDEIVIQRQGGLND